MYKNYSLAKLVLSNETVKTTKRNADIKFNERTISEYTKESVDPPYSEIAKQERYDKFRAKFTPEKGKLRIIINTMHRRQIKQFNEKKDRQEIKEYLTYDTTYEGYDWLGNPLRNADNIEGIYHKPKFTITTTINPETGEYIYDKQLAGQETVYYIEITDKNRKKVIEDIINKSNSNPEEIKYYYHVPDTLKGSGFRCSIYTYDQFINSSSSEMEHLARSTPSPYHKMLEQQYLAKDSKPYMG